MARVLVVDDDPAIRALIRVFLEADTGFEVIGEAGDCEAAVKAATELAPELVTMDHQLPGSNGVDCIREIKKQRPDVHVLAITGSGDVVGQKMIDAGAYAKIDKAHLQAMLPALYQVADRRAMGRKEPAGALNLLRTAVATLEANAAVSLQEKKNQIAERLELVDALHAIHLAASNARYSETEALRLIKELTTSVLDTPAANP